MVVQHEDELHLLERGVQLCQYRMQNGVVGVGIAVPKITIEKDTLKSKPYVSNTKGCLLSMPASTRNELKPTGSPFPSTSPRSYRSM